MKAMRIQNVPDAAGRAAFYEAIAAEPMTPFLYARPFQRRRFERVQALLAPMLPLCERVLEVGPCEGKLTEWLVAQGVEVTAVEISERCVERAMERVPDGVEWLLADIDTAVDEFALDGRRFDLVIATSVLEHQVHPYRLMARLRALTDVVLASVPISEAPNEDAFSVAAYRNPKRAADGTGHIWYFRPDTFRALFRQVRHYEDDRISAIGIGAP